MCELVLLMVRARGDGSVECLAKLPVPLTSRRLTTGTMGMVWAALTCLQGTSRRERTLCEPCQEFERCQEFLCCCCAAAAAAQHELKQRGRGSKGGWSGAEGTDPLKTCHTAPKGPNNTVNPS